MTDTEYPASVSGVLGSLLADIRTSADDDGGRGASALVRPPPSLLVPALALDCWRSGAEALPCCSARSISIREPFSLWARPAWVSTISSRSGFSVADVASDEAGFQGEYDLIVSLNGENAPPVLNRSAGAGGRSLLSRRSTTLGGCGVAGRAANGPLEGA